MIFGFEVSLKYVPQIIRARAKALAVKLYRPNLKTLSKLFLFKREIFNP